MMFPLIVLAVALVALVIFEGRRCRRRRVASRLRHQELCALSDAAFKKLDRDCVTLRDFQSGRSAVEAAFDSGDDELLRIYARLLGDVEAGQIDSVVILMRATMKKGSLHSLRPSTITAEQVRVFHQVGTALDSGDCLRPGSEASKIAIFAMAHVDDSDVMVEVAQRGCRSLVGFQSLLSEMKSLPSRALSEGML